MYPLVAFPSGDPGHCWFDGLVIRRSIADPAKPGSVAISVSPEPSRATKISKCGPQGRTVLVPVQSALRVYFVGWGASHSGLPLRQ